jgi:pyrroloquinoline quinone biosynthesis protein D
MTGAGGAQRLIIERGTRPVLPRHLRLRHDAGRGRWLLLAPERILTPDDIAVSILRLCDGARTVDEIVETLAADYDAAVEDIRGDVIGLLQDMADKRYIES